MKVQRSERSRKPKQVDHDQDADPILKEARKRLENAWQYDKTNRTEALLDLDFLGLSQWPESIRTQRLAEGRPCLTLDHLNQFVKQVINDIRQARLDLRAVGVDSNADPKLAELVTDLMRDIQYQSGAASVYAEAANGQVSCGIGHFRLETTYAEDSVSAQDIKVRLIPFPLSVYWDPAATMPDRSDAQWVFVTQHMQLEDFKAKYPNAKPVDVTMPKDSETGGGFFWSSEDEV